LEKNLQDNVQNLEAVKMLHNEVVSQVEGKRRTKTSVPRKLLTFEARWLAFS
jgi:hypothetical protein